MAKPKKVLPPTIETRPGLSPSAADQSTNAAEPSDWKPWPLWLTVFGWLLLAALVASLSFATLGRLMGGDWNPWNNKTKPNVYELARSTVAITGLLGAAVAAGIATRRQRSHEREVEISRRTHLLAAETYALELRRDATASTKSLRERYGTAAGQLGHEAAAMRLAGVYAMAALADDWLTSADPNQREAQSCIEVLVGYLRTPHGLWASASDSDAAAEREVRQTIVRVIGSHLQAGAEPSWSWCDYHFTGAKFVGDTSFANCQFDAKVSFAGAVFEGPSVSFERAHFGRGRLGPARVSFEGARFDSSRVLFTSAVFERLLVFGDVKIASARANFTNAEFHAEARFVDCAFEATTGVSLEGIEIPSGVKVSFKACQINGSPNLDTAILHGGSLSFEDCTILGRLGLAGVTLLDNATLTIAGGALTTEDARVDLTGTTIQSGAIKVSSVDLQAGQFDLSSATFGEGTFTIDSDFSRVRVDGPWGKFTGHWPGRAEETRSVQPKENHE